MKLGLQKQFIVVAFLAVLLLTAVISFLAAAKTRSALLQASEKQGLMLAQTVSALIINELIYEKLGLVEESNRTSMLVAVSALDWFIGSLIGWFSYSTTHSALATTGAASAAPSKRERRLVTTTVTAAAVAVPSPEEISSWTPVCTTMVLACACSAGLRCRVFLPIVRVDAGLDVRVAAEEGVVSVKLFFM